MWIYTQMMSTAILRSSLPKAGTRSLAEAAIFSSIPRAVKVGLLRRIDERARNRSAFLVRAAEKALAES